MASRGAGDPGGVAVGPVGDGLDLFPIRSTWHMIVDMRHLLAILSVLLALGNTASAQAPPCLQFHAPSTISCGPLHGSEPIATPRPLYAPWKGMALSGQSATHYLVYSGVGPTGEPLFKQNGVGLAHTAEEWLASGTGGFFFDTVDGRDPHEPDGSVNQEQLTPPITIRGHSTRDGAFPLRGFAYFNTRELRFGGRHDAAASTSVRQPSEPFFDLGIDLDHDGVICAERGPDACCPDSTDGPEAITRCNEFLTVMNSRWDVELDAGCDPHVAACGSDGPTADAPWPPQRPEWTAFIRMHAEHQDSGADPRMLGMLAHEPFLEWGDAAPRDDAPPMRWSFARETRHGGGARTTNPPPWAAATAGFDRSEGEIVAPLSLQGMLYNEGRIVLGDGFAASGVVLAAGGVIVPHGARLMWSSDFARGTFPPREWKDMSGYCDRLMSRAAAPTLGSSR